jgi:hypothetical protein
MPRYGDESGGIGGCGPCDSAVVHFRIVFRYLNAVELLYIYGSDQFAYRDVALHLASILDERIRAAPTGPRPDVMAENISPQQIALSAAELGKEIDTVGQQEGSDERGPWYWSRYKRTREKETAHIGPLDIYSKVWVARDIESANQIFDEEARPGMPEAHETVGVNFPMEPLPGVGNQNFGWSACNENCMTTKFRYLHHRYVLRVGNVVMVLYTWGGNQDNSINQVGFYAQSMRDRIK